MVIKGGSISGAARFAAHLERTDTNEIRNEVIEMRDVAAPDLRGALREMEAVASACPNCKKPLYQASINTQAHERMTDEQRMQAVDRLEKELGLTGQPRVVVVHEKNDGREHCHVVWSRIDLDKMRTISDSHNFRKHEIVARELEREFGHERVQGAHIERDGKPRPASDAPPLGDAAGRANGRQSEAGKGASDGDMAARPKTVRRSRGARRNRAGFWRVATGVILSRLDQKGGTHSLSRRIEGATAKDVRARLADLDLNRCRASPRRGRRSRRAMRRRQRVRPRRRKHRRAIPAQPSVSRSPEASKGREAIRAAEGAARAAGGAVKTAGKILDGMASAFEGLLGGGSSPRPRDAAKEGREQPDDNRRPLDAGPVPPPEMRAEAVKREEEQKSTRRQELLRDYGREVLPETEQDAKIERDQRNRGGGRERER